LPLAAFAGQLHIHVTDETGRPVWTRVEVRGPGGKMYQAEGAIRDLMKKARGGAPYYLGSFVVQGDATVNVPDGHFTVIAEHGLEYERGQKEVDIRGARSVNISFHLRPWIRMRDRGWYSGDVHIHQPLKELPALAEAEDLNVNVLTNRNKQQMFREPWPVNPVMEVSLDHLMRLSAQDAAASSSGSVTRPARSVVRVLLLTSAEDERRGGSWILDGLRKPLALERESGWYPPGIVYVRQARAQREPGDVFPWFDIDMPIWWEVPVMMALETPDSLDILHNQFMQYGIDQSEYWGRPRDRVKFSGWRGFVDYSLGLYYRYLNLGFHVPPTAGTGSGVMPSPPGYNRVYSHLNGPLTIENWFRAIRDGHSFVTNGPMLFVHTSKSGTKITVSIEARAREPLESCEIVANGEILKRFMVKRGSLKFHGLYSFDASGHSWVAARCFLATRESIRLAHSTPVYLDGHWDARGDAQYFAAWINELIEQTQSDQNRFADEERAGRGGVLDRDQKHAAAGFRCARVSDEQRTQVLELYRRALKIYQAKAQ